MKKCPRCEQAYGDDTNFCLSDGSTLVSAADSFASNDETPTVYSGAPPPTNYGSGAPPFVPQVSPVAPAVEKKSSTLLIALVVGFFALLAGGAVVGVVMYGLNSSDKKETNVAVVSNSPDKSNQNAVWEKKSDTDNTAQNLKEQQAKLEREKQKLDEERRRLEEKKKEATPTTATPPTSARTAVIIDPPSNIRSAPNGSVLCVARTRGTVVNILGSTGVTDNNGTWYYTDYCGRQGVIHSTQFRF